MFCSKCGKQIDYDAKICNECLAAEQAANESASAPVNQVVEPAPQQNGSVMTGFKGALTSVILSIIASFFIGLTSGWILEAVEELETSGRVANSTEGLLFAGIVFCVIAMILSIPSIILGAKSIKVFKKEKLLGNKKPIPALVMGIYSVVECVLLIIVAILFIAVCVLYRTF